MRTDIVVAEAIAKCEVLKRSQLWLPEPHIRPRAWLDNFDDPDKVTAAYLLDRFTFYSSRLTDRLLVAAYQSLGDGLSKGPSAPSTSDLVKSLNNAVVTPVEGENPNPTDSGYLLCRKARQVLGVSEDAIVKTADAVTHAESGATVVFVDDFVGSGDQFIETWKRLNASGVSFRSVHDSKPFVAIYMTLVMTRKGMQRINAEIPSAALCPAHILEKRSTIDGIDPSKRAAVDVFLQKYASRLTPAEPYISKQESFKRLGYKHHGLMLAFEHSVPDATLPIFWSPAPQPWEPLIGRH